MKLLSAWKMAVTVFALCAATAIAAPAQTFTNLVGFDGTDGAFPEYMSFVQGGDGSLYGTTLEGGAYDKGSVSGGTAFKITPKDRHGTNATAPKPLDPPRAGRAQWLPRNLAARSRACMTRADL